MGQQSACIYCSTEKSLSLGTVSTEVSGIERSAAPFGSDCQQDGSLLEIILESFCQKSLLELQSVWVSRSTQPSARLLKLTYRNRTVLINLGILRLLRSIPSLASLPCCPYGIRLTVLGLCDPQDQLLVFLCFAPKSSNWPSVDAVYRVLMQPCGITWSPACS